MGEQAAEAVGAGSTGQGNGDIEVSASLERVRQRWGQLWPPERNGSPADVEPAANGQVATQSTRAGCAGPWPGLQEAFGWPSVEDHGSRSIAATRAEQGQQVAPGVDQVERALEDAVDREPGAESIATARRSWLSAVRWSMPRLPSWLRVTIPPSEPGRQRIHGNSRDLLTINVRSNGLFQVGRMPIKALTRWIRSHGQV